MLEKSTRYRNGYRWRNKWKQYWWFRRFIYQRFRNIGLWIRSISWIRKTTCLNYGNFNNYSNHQFGIWRNITCFHQTCFKNGSSIDGSEVFTSASFLALEFGVTLSFFEFLLIRLDVSDFFFDVAFFVKQMVTSFFIDVLGFNHLFSCFLTH